MNYSLDLPAQSELRCGAAEEYFLTRFVLVLSASSSAVLGVAANLLLCYIFTRKASVDTPPTVYPTVLSVLDAFLCTVYVLLFTVDVIANYLRVYNLFVVYHVYIVPVFTLAKVVQFAIPYMLILGTLERYAWISRNCAKICLFSSGGRTLSAVLCIIFSVIVRLPPYFAMAVEEYPDCKDQFRTLSIELRQWAVDSALYKQYEFYVVVVIQMTAPFFVLIALNALIIRKLRSTTGSLTGGEMAHASPRKMSPVLRNAVHTTVAIATSYLTCSALQLAIIILESNNSSLLRQANA